MISIFHKKSFKWAALIILILAAIGVIFLINSRSGEMVNAPDDKIVDSGTKIQDVKAPDDGVKDSVEALLTEITQNGPSSSSNPYDYIKDSQAFEKLVSIGQPALDYMFESFSKGNGDGLREYIMACACAKIMGIFDEEDGIDIKSGREWFYKYGKIEVDAGFQQVDADYDRYAHNEDAGKITLPDDVNKTDMEDVVSNYILAVNRNAYKMGEKAIESHKILGSEENSGVISLYMAIGFGWFGFEDGTFTIVSGGGDIVRMQLLKSVSGEYEVTEYKRALDGGMWAGSIREMFPKDLAEKVIKGDEETGDGLWPMEVERAEAYLKQIGRGDAPISKNVKKERLDEGKSKAIYLASLMRSDFPDWDGTREMLFRAGGPAPGSKVRCIFETRCEGAGDNGYEVTLTKTWDITINGKQPVSYWKYRVSGDNIQLVESVDNDSMIQTIK